MVAVEAALRTISQHGGCLDTDTGKLNIPSRVLGKEEIKRAVKILKEAGPDKVKAVLASVQAPYIDKYGVLIIPFGSNPKYHWWAGGQTILETLQELKAAPEIIALYGPGGGSHECV